MIRRLSLAAFATLAAAHLANLSLAGPLTPPPGPVVGAGRTMQEIFDKAAELEPRTAITLANTPGDANSIVKITTRGTYYLTANITGSAGRHGIEVAAPHVTIDLNGFDIVGVPGSLDGIHLNSTNAFNVRIANGSIHAWGGSGIDASGSPATPITFENIHVFDCGGDGIHAGSSARILRCNSTSNLQAGFAVADNCLFVDCDATSNSAGGYVAGDAAAASRCVARSNIGAGFNLGARATVNASGAFSNSADGFSLAAGAHLENTTADSNGGDGIQTSDNASITSCHAYDNTGNGIVTANTCSINLCTSTSNTLDGFNTLKACLIASCTATSNDRDGIRARDGCYIRDNACSHVGPSITNTGSGIHISGIATRLEGNLCTYNGTGIRADGPSNLIIRNTVSANGGSWNLAVGNLLGPIIDLSASAGSPSVVGGSAPSSLATTDPNANFTF